MLRIRCSVTGLVVIGLIEATQNLLPNPTPLDAFEGARVTRTRSPHLRKKCGSARKRPFGYLSDRLNPSFRTHDASAWWVPAQHSAKQIKLRPVSYSPRSYSVPKTSSIFWMYKRAEKHVDGHSVGKRLLMILGKIRHLAAARPFARDPML
jgi:hypothetical protein